MSTLISLAPNRELPFVFGDLFQISSKLSYYSLGGIQQITSVISGQYAKDKTRHEETTQSEWFTEQERTEEHESSTMESTHEAMQSAVSETVANSRSFGGAAAVEGKFGTVRASVSLSYDNDQSKSQSRSDATDFAHEVVEQSRELVRQRTLSSRRENKTVVDTVERTRGYDNRDGESSAFIMRFVEEVHLFSLVQHGKYLQAKFILPFPQANYLNAVEAGTRSPAAAGSAADPGGLTYVDRATHMPVTITAADVSTEDTQPGYWFKLASAFGLAEPTPPPDAMAEAFAFNFAKDQVDQNEYGSATGSVKVPEGYRCKGLFVRSWAETWHGGAPTDIEHFFVGVVAGKHNALFKGWGSHDWLTENELDLTFDEELHSGELPFTLYSRSFKYGTFSLYFRFTPTPTLLKQWQLQFFEELRKAHSDATAAPVTDLIGVQVADLRSSPTAAEAMIKGELERASIQFVMGTDLTGLGAVDRKKKPFPQYPELDIPRINQLQPILDFLYRGFDFEKMSHQFLPTSLGAPEERFRAYAGAAAGTGMLGEFLSAGAVEIVLPVSSGREEQLFFFQQTGLLFSGSDVPLPDDPIVLALYDEILEARALVASDDPVLIDSWEVTLPTPHVILQEDARMPDWRDDGALPGTVSGKALTPQQSA